jgi:hypothetical protein
MNPAKTNATFQNIRTSTHQIVQRQFDKRLPEPDFRLTTAHLHTNDNNARSVKVKLFVNIYRARKHVNKNVLPYITPFPLLYECTITILFSNMSCSPDMQDIPGKEYMPLTFRYSS